MISKSKKYDLIVKLLKEDRTNREICEIARCSPNTITNIRKTIEGYGTDKSTEMKGKSICAQVFDLLEKGTSITQIVIKVDINPEEAIRIQDKYLHMSKRDGIIDLLKDQNGMALNIEILEFLKENPRLLKQIKETMDLQFVVWNLMADREEIEHDIEVDKKMHRHYDEQLKKKEKQLGLPRSY
jgi:hypothetical protein